ncbi:hypothetical protein [Streptomyces acidicola]|nr:hypothetical protein [Streptomyces acidicola]
MTSGRTKLLPFPVTGSATCSAGSKIWTKIWTTKIWDEEEE